MGDPVQWIEQYAKKDPKELVCFATCVVGGYAWRVSPEGRTYCAGKASKVKEMTDVKD